MAYIGMRYPVAAVVNSHTDGSSISYSTPGFVMGNAVQATINYEINDNPDYGDDIIIDNDNGISGYSGTIDLNAITADVRNKLLGWAAVGTTPDYYSVSDDAAPDVGFGFIHVSMYKGTKSFEAYWFHKAQFAQSTVNASTKERQITWNHPQLSFQGKGCYIDASGKAKYFDWMTFESEAAAKTWLKSKAGIT